jgi:hypothetical protein
LNLAQNRQQEVRNNDPSRIEFFLFFEIKLPLTLTPPLSEAINAYLWHWAISQWQKATSDAPCVLGEGEYGLPSPRSLRSDERLPLAVGKWLRSIKNGVRILKLTPKFQKA